VPYDRSFFLKFKDDSKIVFKLHGNTSNILLINNLDKVESLFNSHIKQDLNLDLMDLQKAKPTIPSDFETIEELINSNSFIGKNAKQQIHSKLKTIDNKESQLSEFQYFISNLENPKNYYLDKESSNISFFRDDNGSSFTSAIEVSNEQYKQLKYYYFFTLKKQNQLLDLEKLINKKSNYTSTLQAQLNRFKTETSLKEKADVVMANLHLLTESNKVYSLLNFYTNSSLEITLKKNEKPQKLAEKWYSKSKNQHKQIENIELKIEKNLLIISELKQKRTELAYIEQARDLAKFLHTEEKKESEQKTTPFKYLKFEEFDIYIGKNAQNNDELIKFGNKNDLWLHAKDVSGSHVLIHSIGKKIPLSVLEKAASLAAYYSKRKTDSICPVIYTELKYVRKRKGMPAGQVFLDREKVLFAHPQGLTDSDFEK
jgi:predicted ribosome quality control (RQC) complex YloA/Tae2 family protein